jgi:hypothetical protein
MPARKQMAFAATDTLVQPPHILAWTINGTARAVRNEIGKAWRRDDPSEGWKEAKRDGMRVVKIEMRISGA